tara:strand:+ start:260 stop:382 length:123 start_codon:yes stop_codon:yes gene_type:complete
MTPLNVFLTAFLFVFVAGLIIKIREEANMNTWWDDDTEDW